MYYPPINDFNLQPYQKQASELVEKINTLQQYKTAYPAFGQPVVAPHIDYVHGLDGARAFLNNMPAGGKAVLMDEDEAKFYVVSKDANGTPAQIAFAHFSLEFEEQEKAPSYVTKQDFDDFKAELLDMLNKRGNGA